MMARWTVLDGYVSGKVELIIGPFWPSAVSPEKLELPDFGQYIVDKKGH